MYPSRNAKKDPFTNVFCLCVGEWICCCWPGAQVLVAAGLWSFSTMDGVCDGLVADAAALLWRTVSPEGGAALARRRHIFHRVLVMLVSLARARLHVVVGCEAVSVCIQPRWYLLLHQHLFVAWWEHDRGKFRGGDHYTEKLNGYIFNSAADVSVAHFATKCSLLWFSGVH